VGGLKMGDYEVSKEINKVGNNRVELLEGVG